LQDFDHAQEEELVVITDQHQKFRKWEIILAMYFGLDI